MKGLLLSLALLSTSTLAYNTEYSKLVPGKQILVDSAYNNHKNGHIVSLTLDTESTQDVEPTVKVVKQWSGFECTHKQTLISFAGFNQKTKAYKRTWEIQIDWIPGADLSACIVRVEFPGMKAAEAEIFMNY